MGWCDFFNDFFDTDKYNHVDEYNSYTYDDFHNDDFREEIDLYEYYREHEEDEDLIQRRKISDL